tara:strand:+ start:907 stop:1128 length:222 start_codon:yes stop_codon:yes gene_type:complete
MVDIVGAMLTHNLSKLPHVEQDRLRTEFAFEGVSLGVTKDFELLRSIRASLKRLKDQEILEQSVEPKRGKKKS